MHDERLVARRLGAFVRILVASRGYVAAHPVRRPDDLTRLAATWTLEGRQASREVAVRGSLAARGFAALLRAAHAGLGIARVPTFVAKEALESGALVRVLPGWAAPPTEVFLVYRFGHDRIRRVKALIEAAQERVAAFL